MRFICTPAGAVGAAQAHLFRWSADEAAGAILVLFPSTSSAAVFKSASRGRDGEPSGQNSGVADRWALGLRSHGSKYSRGSMEAPRFDSELERKANGKRGQTN